VSWARHRWTYDGPAPGSVVLHERATSTDPDSPGDAGDRVGCVPLAAR
jgi:hypothetical protein